jgi:hypothetical protein
MMAGQAEGYEKCISCGHRLFCAVSKARGYGWGCWARIRKAARRAMEALAAFTARQLEQARELIEDAAIIPGHDGLFYAVSSDGEDVYEVTAEACSFPAGRACYHRAAVAILAAA